LEELGHLADLLFTRLALTSASLRLHADHIIKQVIGLDLRGGDLSVIVKTEGLGIWVQRHRADVIHVVFLVARGQRVVDSRFRELAALDQNLRVDVALEDALDQADVLALSNSATVVDLSTEHVQHCEGNLIISLDELLQLSAANNEILIGKGVRNVPADRTELTAILHNSVEEAEAEQEFLVNFRLGAFFELLCGERVIGLEDIGLKTRRRLQSHLD